MSLRPSNLKERFLVLKNTACPSEFQFLFSQMEFCSRPVGEWTLRILARQIQACRAVSSPQEGAVYIWLFRERISGVSQRILGLSEGPSSQWGDPLYVLYRFFRSLYCVCPPYKLEGLLIYVKVPMSLSFLV